jgi:hypothetical protein
MLVGGGRVELGAGCGAPELLIGCLARPRNPFASPPFSPQDPPTTLDMFDLPHSPIIKDSVVLTPLAQPLLNIANRSFIARSE